MNIDFLIGDLRYSMKNDSEKPREPFILSIGGGKGGVGKSMMSANLAVQYAKAGLKVILIDLDVGAANLHTIFGMRQPPKGLADYFVTPYSHLSDYCLETGIENLFLIPGSGFMPELANLKHAQKVKIINQVKSLKADLVLLDLGAGSSNNVVDFFSLTHAGIVVTTPEPTAVVNAYEFLKNVLYRILSRLFRQQDKILDILKKATLPNQEAKNGSIANLIEEVSKQNAWAAQNIRDICEDLDIYLVFNQARRTSDAQLGQRLNEICQRYLGFTLNFAGMVFFNEEVSNSVFKMTPISLAYPDSVTSQTIKKIALGILGQIVSKWDGEMRDSFDSQLSRVLDQAKKDFSVNHLTQKRLLREKASKASLVETEFQSGL